MPEYIAAQASVLLVPSVKGFRDKLKAALSTIDENVKIGIDLNDKKLAEAAAEIEAFKEAMQADPIDLKVKFDEDSFKKSITEIRHQYQDVKRDLAKALELNVKINGLAAIPQAGTAMAALNQSVVALSQSSLLLPGILSGVAASVGTLLTGAHGLTGAFKELSTEQKNGSQAAQQHRDALKSVDEASRDLARSTKDAKRNLEDLNDQLRDAPLDEADALINLQQAQQEAADKWGKTALQQQRDILNIDKAESQLAETRKKGIRLAQDAAEANKKGVAGADGVVSAQDRLTKANEAAGKSGQKWSDAMSQLSPKAQQFMQDIKGMQGVWSGFQNSVQDHFIDGLGNSIKSLATSDLPLLQKGMDGVADGLNNNLKTAITSLTSGSNQSFMERIFGNSAQAQQQFSNVIKPMIDGFMHLGAVGSEYLPQLTNALGEVMSRFNNFVDKADKTGDLKKWIDQGNQAFKDMGNSLINLGSILNSINEAFTGQGGRGMLQLLEVGTKRLSDFLKSAEGQQKLVTFFQNTRAELQRFEPILRDLPGMFHSFSGAIQDWSAISAPILHTIAGLLSQYPALADAIVFAFAGWKTISPIISGVSGVLKSNFADAVKQAISAVGAAYSNGGLSGAISSLAGLVSPGGLLMTGLGAVAAMMAYKWVQSNQDAAAAASAHADQLHRVNSELDQMTGSLSKAAAAQQLKDLGEYNNPSLRGKQLNIPQMAEGLGVSRGELVNSLDPTQQGTRNDVLSRLDKLVDQSLENNKNNGDLKKSLESLAANGFSKDDLAKALGGDQSAIDQFNKVRNTPGVRNPGDLNSIRGELDSQGQSALDVAGAIRSRSGANLDQGNAMRKDNAGVYGTATLKPGTPFAGLGSPRAYPSADGGLDIQVDAKDNQIPDQLRKDIQANGGQITPMLNGSVIHLTKDRAGLYADINSPTAGNGAKLPGFYKGAIFKGPGSGTSDSMIARVSSGEAITPASVVGRNPDLFHGLHDGSIDPAHLPGFAGGDPQIKIPNNPLIPAMPAPTAPELPFGGAPAPAGGADWQPPMDMGGAPSFTDMMPPELKRQQNTGLGGLLGANDAPGVGLGPAGGPQSPVSPVPMPGRGSGMDIPNPFTSNPMLDKKPGRSFYSDWYPAGGSPNAGGTGGAGNSSNPQIDNKTYDAAHPWKADGTGGWIPGGSGGTPHLAPGSTSAPGPMPHFTGNSSPGPGNFGPGASYPAAQGVPGGFAPPAMPGVMPGIGNPFGGGFGSPMGGGLGGNQMQNLLLNPAQQLGNILMTMVLGFFGISPSVMAPLSQLFGGGGQGGLFSMFSPYNQANPAAGAMIGGYANPTGIWGPGAPAIRGQAMADNSMAGEVADQMAGKPYVWGANSLSGADCSGLVSMVVNAYTGNPSSTDRTSTPVEGAWLSGKGAIMAQSPDQIPPGALAIGWNADHTAGTLPDGRNFESSTPGAPIQVGAGAQGAKSSQFDHWAYFMPGTGAPAYAPAQGSVPQPIDANLTSAVSSAHGANWDAVAQGESSGNWSINTGNGFFGGLQFTQSSWEAAGGTKFASRADLATPEQQKTIADNLLAMQGPGAWPHTFVGWNADGQIFDGPGSGTSDSMIARVSNGEAITPAHVVGRNPALFRGLIDGSIDPRHLPGFAGGGILDNPTPPGQSSGPLPTPAAAPAPQAAAQPAPPAAAPPAGPSPDDLGPAGMPAASDAVGAPATPPGGASAPAPTTDATPQVDPNSPSTEQQAANAVGGMAGALTGIGTGAGAKPGASGAPGSSEKQDPRSMLGKGPTNFDHNNQGLSSGIQGAASTIGSIASTAASMAINGVAPGAGSAAGAGIQAGAQMAGQIATGATNILSSLLVGTLTPGTTSGAYGTPMLPQASNQQGMSPRIVNNYGDIHTASYDQFYKGQQRREAQQQQPLLPLGTA